MTLPRCKVHFQIWGISICDAYCGQE
jgi:hypothetical protein